MKAALIHKNRNGINYENQKEMISCYNLVGMSSEGELEEVITLRLYMGRSSSASVVYSTVWAHYNGTHVSGSGRAGGYGYCKKSAAAANALESSGFVFDVEIAGRGMDVVEQALKAVAVELGFTGPLLLITNG